MFVRNVASRSAFKIRYLKTYSSADLGSKYRFFPTGSTALIKLLQNLHISNGSSILIPSFICDSVTSALECSGYKVVFIEPDRNPAVARSVIIKASCRKEQDRRRLIR